MQYYIKYVLIVLACPRTQEDDFVGDVRKRVNEIVPFLEEAAKGSSLALATAIAYLLARDQGRVSCTKYLSILRAIRSHAGNELYACVEAFLSTEEQKLTWGKLREQGLPIITEEMAESMENLIHAVESVKQVDGSRCFLGSIRKAIAGGTHPSLAA